MHPDSPDLDAFEHWARRCAAAARSAPDAVSAATHVLPILLEFGEAYRRLCGSGAVTCSGSEIEPLGYSVAAEERSPRTEPA